MQQRPYATIVSGLPRSGTSMLMRMLHAGGMPLLIDDSRPPDDDNLTGYFEYAPVKRLDRDASFLGEATGKAIKIVSPLLRFLPKDLPCRVVLMRRALPEVLVSQRVMMQRRAVEIEDDQEISAAYLSLEAAVNTWLHSRGNTPLLELNYRAVINHPDKVADQLSIFLNGGLDIAAMAKAVDPNLYRQRQKEEGPA